MVTAAYSRKSRALGDPDDPELLAHHVARLRRLAEADGIALPAERTYLEIGSGDTIAERPVFRRLLEEWERLPPDTGGVLYCVELSRLSRGSLAERGRIFAALQRAGIRIRTPGRTYDLSDPDDELLFAFFSAIDRHELGRYRRRVRDKKDQMTREGKLTTGGDRYGYRWDKNTQTLVPHEPEFSIAAALYRDAVHLSDLQLAARYGLPPDRISDILRNPVYSGWPHRHTQETDRGSRWLPRSEWLLAEKPGSWPAVCSVELWEAVQAARRRRYRERAKPGAANGWCRDILVLIDDAGREYRPHLSARTLRTRSVPTYVAVGAEYILHVERETVHAAALQGIRSVCRDRDFLLQAAARYQSRQRAETTSASSPHATETLSARIAELRRELDALLLEQVRAATPELRASVARVRAGHEQEIERLRQQQRQDDRQETPVDLAPLLPLLPRLAELFDAVWAETEEPERRALANALIERLPARVLRTEPRRPYRREVGPVVYREWVREEGK